MDNGHGRNGLDGRNAHPVHVHCPLKNSGCSPQKQVGCGVWESVPVPIPAINRCKTIQRKIRRLYMERRRPRRLPVSVPVPAPW